MQKISLGFLALLVLLISPVMAEEVKDDIIARGDMVVTKDLLIYQITKPGDGAVAQVGDNVEVHYTGWLVDGTKFDSSLSRDKSFHFQIGAHRVIPGWERGVAGMRVGETRELIIPAKLAYGKGGAGNGLIPPDAVLLFEVSLLSIGKR